MNKENLEKLKQLQQQITTFDEMLKAKKEVFEETNASLISDIKETNQKIEKCKEIAKENAEAGYDKDGIKQRLGGIGIRITKKLEYEENNALEWAKNNMNVAVKTIIDKKLFDKFAKNNVLDFVKITEKVTVTFPKNIGDLNKEEQ